MIPKETIDKIFDTSRIDEVVGDFVSLKKRGVNLLGLCPFHNEKTPSFTVSPAKGIYKCFGCGKGGNSVNFIMDHEQLTYPEALRYLAKKYNIEIAEEEQTEEQKIEQSERESLFVVSSFAQKHFSNNLHNTDEGRSVGLSYFKERGFREDIIDKFQLGYSLDKWRGFTDAALEAGYKLDYLVKAGLTIRSESQESRARNPELLPGEASLNSQQQAKIFDRFSGRVIFPVHNLTGRVIAFGGRTLKTDKKVAKYINSPETDIYHKSNVLYGMFFAKKSIIAEDSCYLVEGYTDVTSMHQAGIENVVASSGTSLTVEQIRQIRRYTQNITILYDGDSAGIKASFRGIDLILEEGMNVRVLLFPDGEDPDSFSKKTNSADLKKFIIENSKDFISFKTNLLYSEVQNDPIRKASLIKEIVESIAIIPDAIPRSVYIKECSRIMQMDEQTLLNELNKIRRKKTSDNRRKDDSEESSVFIDDPEQFTTPQKILADDCEFQERDIIRILLNFGNQEVVIDGVDEEGNKTEAKTKVSELIVQELKSDNIKFDNQVYQKVFDEFSEAVERAREISQNNFINYSDPEVNAVAIDLISFPHSLSGNWEKHGIFVQTEEKVLRKSALNAVYSLKIKKLTKMIDDNQRQLKETSAEQKMMELLQQQNQLNEAKKYFASLLGRVMIK
jgi:DNA primase